MSELPSSFYGAVDLTPLAQRAQAGQGSQSSPAGQAGPMGGPAGQAGPGGAPGEQGPARVPVPYSVNLTQSTLSAAVELSMRVPVIIVVTSPRAEGSEQLFQDLADMAPEFGGRYQAAQVEADKEAALMGAFGVQVIPSVLMLVNGSPFPAFQGVPDKEQVRGVIPQLLMAAAEAGVAGAVTGEEGAEPEPEPVDPNMQAGIEAIEAGDLDAAEKHFTKAGIENPRSEEPRSALAQVHLMKRLGDRDPVELLEAAAAADPADIAVQLAAADVEIATGRAREGLERVLAVVEATFDDEQEMARKRLVDLFDVVGQHTKLVGEIRRRLASALY